jgi:prepilin-type processing-associated H-X9-DG protein
MGRITAILVALLGFLLVPLTASAQALADRLPDDAILYIGWRGTSDLGAGYEQSHLKRILDQSDWSKLLNQSLPGLIAKASDQNPTAAQVVQIICAFGQPLWQHASAFYFGGLDFTDPQHPNPRLALLCDAGDQADAMTDKAMSLVEMAGKNFPIKIFVKSFGQLVVISTFEWAEHPQQRLSARTEFTSTMAQVGEDPVLAVYLDGQRMLKQIDTVVATSHDPGAAAMWLRVREALGLDGLLRVAATDRFAGGDFCGQLFVACPSPRVGLMSLLDEPALSDDLLKTIPSTATMAMAGQFDLGKLFSQVRRGIQLISPATAAEFDAIVVQAGAFLDVDIQKDLLGAFGSEWAAYSDPSIGGVGPLGTVFINHAADATRLETSLTKLEQFADTAIGAVEQANLPWLTVEFRHETVDGLNLHYAALPLITPAWAIQSGFWYASLYPQVTVSAATAGQSSSLRDNAAYQDMRKRLGGPASVNAVAFVDTAKLAPQGYQTLLMTTRLFLGAGDLVGLEAPPMVVPPLSKIMPELDASGGIAWTDEAGYHSTSIEPFPGAAALSAGGNMSAQTLSAAPVLVSILVPSLNRARETANRVKCASNMRQIGLGILLYQNDNGGKYPPDLGTLLNAEDLTLPVFLCPSSGTQLPPGWGQWTADQKANWINANADYIYVGAGMKSGGGPSQVVMYERDEDHHDGINILFADGHVEFERLSQAHRLIDQIKPPRP